MSKLYISCETNLTSGLKVNEKAAKVHRKIFRNSGGLLGQDLLARAERMNCCLQQEELREGRGYESNSDCNYFRMD